MNKPNTVTVPMSKPYLEITNREGKPFAAYLYLPRRQGDKVARSVSHGEFVADFAEDGRMIGVEITGFSYLSLMMRFPLKHIKDAAHLEEAHKVIDELSIIPENELTEGQRDYLLALGDLTAAFEDPLVREDMAKITDQPHGLPNSACT